MTLIQWLAFAIGVGLFAYLVGALLWPERF
jgi:K+-transporting ATPase KdpF subunit